jgi:pentatricopeptide repeat protein
VQMYCKCGYINEAIQVFDEMIKHAPKPDYYTYSIMLNGCADSKILTYGKKVHAALEKSGIKQDDAIMNTLIHMYGHCGSVHDAERIFTEKANKKDIIAWNTMLMIYAVHGNPTQAEKALAQMQSSNITPNSRSFLALLMAYGHAKMVKKAKTLFRDITTKYGIIPDILHYNSMINVLARANLLDQAEEMINQMSEPNFISYMSLLNGCHLYRDVKRGIQTAHTLLKLKPNDSSTLIILANLYSTVASMNNGNCCQTIS